MLTQLSSQTETNSYSQYLIAVRMKKLEQHGANRHCELFWWPNVLIGGIEWFGSRVESGRCGYNYGIQYHSYYYYYGHYYDYH